MHRISPLRTPLTVLALVAACSSEDEPPLMSGTPLADGGGAADAGNATPDTGLGGTPGGGSPGGGSPGGGTPGGGGSPDGGCGGSRADAPLVRAPVDVIWALDQSLSMIDEALQVTANINDFANNIATSGANVRVVMDTTLDPASGSALAMDPNRYRFVLGAVQSNNAFEELLNTFPAYQDFLRPDAATHIIIITDDSPGLMGWEQFRTQMEQRLGHPFIFHAIASPPSMPCLGAFGSGEQYFNLAQATGGQGIPVCSSDWTSVFRQLESAVVSSAPLPCEFVVPPPPSGETLDYDAVKVVYKDTSDAEREFPRAETMDVCAANTAWYYSQARDKVLLCPSACEAVRGGGSIDVAFGCEPMILR